MAGRVFAVTVGGETCHRWIITAGCALDDKQQKSRSKNGSQDLGHYIAGRKPGIHLLANDHSDSHSRIDMTAGDRPDGINHCEQREAEGEGNAKKADFFPRQNSASTTGKNQYEGADEF